MNRNLSEVSRLTLKPILALALVTMFVASLVLDATPVAAQTVPGEFCIEGLVINHKEEPLAGWEVTITNEDGDSIMVESAEGPDNKDEAMDPDILKKGTFKIEDLFAMGSMTETVPLETGTYTATLTLQDGFEAVTPAEFTFPVRSNMKDCVKIRFKVREVRVVEVYKIDRNHQPLEDWTILAKPAEGNAFAESQEADTDAEGRAVFTLSVGSWVFMERPPDKDDVFRPIVPPSGKMELDVSSDQPFDVPYVLVFKNDILNGCIEVVKYGVVPENGEINGEGFITPIPPQPGSMDMYNGYAVAGWGFKLLRMDYSEVEIQYTDGAGMATFDNLPFGPYILIEEDRAGWNELNERIVEVRVDAAGDCVFVQFENEQDESGFAIEGRKLDVNGHYGLAGWTITIKPLAKGGYDDITEVTTNGIGEYRIEFPDNDYRIPGAKFELCEEVQDGWEPLTPTCQIVTLPEKASAFPVMAKDFINQQVGHVEDDRKPHEPGKGDSKGDVVGEKGEKDDSSCPAYHVVKKGDGLFSVGEHYEISAQDMLDANPSVRGNANYWVYVGQRLCIP